MSLVDDSDVTWAQVRPESLLFHKPAVREPKNRTDGLFGSTIRRSPTPRPLLFAPAEKGRLTGVQLLPRSPEMYSRAVASAELYMPVTM